MSKLAQVNELLHRELSMAINQVLEWPEALITIVYVDTSPDLQTVNIGISVLPDRLAGTALKKLKAASGRLAKVISQQTRLRKIPKLYWEFDDTERKAAELDELFLKIDDEL
ncbi:MAG: ribosome-binding factor A [Clostridia bacterium]|nr:ribosome-binding factor A [Clostridia bacterium]